MPYLMLTYLTLMISSSGFAHEGETTDTPDNIKVHQEEGENHDIHAHEHTLEEINSDICQGLDIVPRIALSLDHWQIN